MRVVGFCVFACRLLVFSPLSLFVCFCVRLVLLSFTAVSRWSSLFVLSVLSVCLRVVFVFVRAFGALFVFPWCASLLSFMCWCACLCFVFCAWLLHVHVCAVTLFALLAKLWVFFLDLFNWFRVCVCVGFVCGLFVLVCCVFPFLCVLCCC